MLVPPALAKFLSYVKPYRWMIVAATICGLLKYNIPVVFPWVLKDVIDHLLSPSPDDAQRIHLSMAGLVVLYLFWTGMTYLRSYYADQAGQRLIFDLRHEFFNHLQQMSLSFYERRQVGSVASRLLGDIAIAQNFVGAAFTNTLMDLSSLFLIAVLLFRLNFELAVVSLSIFPLYVVLNRTFKNRIRKTSQLAQQKMEEISGNVHEKLSSMSIIQSFTREKTEERRFMQDNRAYLAYRLANIRNSATASALIGFLTSVAPVLVVWFGAFQVLHKRLSVGELTAFYAYLGMFYGPLNRLTELSILLANSQAAIDRIFEIFSLAPEIVDRPNAKEVKINHGEIRFENVSFHYDDTKPTLRNINIAIPAGYCVALVGASGAGKSTFAKLIPRFYELSSGAILLDGHDNRDIQLKSLRRQIALVPQEPILFSGTIYENILYGNAEASLKEIMQAARSADAHDFVSSLPEGYQTQIGEGGIKLSGGQKQRLALARAFLKDAPILILDEATSAIDSESENSVQSALQLLMQGRTTLIIAHRLSTVQAADLIVVFKEGEIVETGKHHVLLQHPNDVYRRLYENQMHKLFSNQNGTSHCVTDRELFSTTQDTKNGRHKTEKFQRIETTQRIKDSKQI